MRFFGRFLEGSTGHQTSRSLAEKGLCCRCKLSGGRGMVAWEGSSFPAPHKHHSFGPVEKARQQHMVDQKHRNYVHICSEVRYIFPRLSKKCQNWHLQIAGAIYDSQLFPNGLLNPIDVNLTSFLCFHRQGLDGHHVPIEINHLEIVDSVAKSNSNCSLIEKKAFL